MKTINIKDYSIFIDDIKNIVVNKDKKIINTINAHSYIVAKKDAGFKKALLQSDILLPDGEGIVWMAKKLYGQQIKKIAGADIHLRLLDLANENSLKCFYLGASEGTLKLIRKNLETRYSNINFGFHSPPFKESFSNDDNSEIIEIINNFNPDILFIGMTAPKQEKWVLQNKMLINANIICSIGAVFDFIAETKRRAPKWIIDIKLEWLFRSFSAWRLTKRYMYSTPLFLFEVIKIKILGKKAND